MIRYDVALSFAGENRQIVDTLAGSLKSDGYKVFYDNFEKVELWGKDLTVELPKRYEQSRYCIMFISEFYLKKMWTTLERQAIITEFLEFKGNDYLLPVRLDNCQIDIPGLSKLTSYINIDTKNEVKKLIKIAKETLSQQLKDENP